ncbi:hypothetical protein Tco_0706892 [Tanacetum coccineum]|uniref:Uncharacterized protein n=1 Tax=Tanacetum coccineum TaxID=301880 RepID=A0ABQ4Y8Q9_9ASTR
MTQSPDHQETDGTSNHMSFQFEDFKAQYVLYWEELFPFRRSWDKSFRPSILQESDDVLNSWCTEVLPPVQVRILEHSD